MPGMAVGLLYRPGWQPASGHYWSDAARGRHFFARSERPDRAGSRCGATFPLHIAFQHGGRFDSDDHTSADTPLVPGADRLCIGALQRWADHWRSGGGRDHRPVDAATGGKRWLGSNLIFWGLPIVVVFVLWLWLAPPAHTRPVRAGRGQAAGAIPTAMEDAAAQSVAMSDRLPEDTGKRPRVNALHLGILIGGGSLIYFGMNGWIAPYNVAIHASALTPPALAILNAAQLPVSLAVTLFAQRLAGRRLPFIIAGLVCGLSIAGWLLAPATLEPLWAALLGGSSAFVFTLGIALPPLLALPHEVARLTGNTISLTYAVAFVGPFAGGELWDILHIPAMAFLPVIIASLMLIILGTLLPSRAQFGLQPAP